MDLGMFGSFDWAKPQTNQYSFGPTQDSGYSDSWTPQNNTMAPSAGSERTYISQAHQQRANPGSVNQTDGTLLGTTFGPTQQSQFPTQFPNQQPAPSAPQMSREQYRDAWMSAGPMTWQGMQDWIARNGGQILSGNGTVRTPYGDVLDMGINARGAQAGSGMITPGWTRVDGGGFPGQGGGVANNPIFGPQASQGQGQDQSGMMNSIAQLLKYLNQNNTGYAGGMTGNQNIQPRYNFNPNPENPQMDISSFLGPRTPRPASPFGPGYYGGYEEGGVRHPGNEPGRMYMLGSR